MNYSIFFSLYSLAHQSMFLDGLIIFCARYLIYISIIFVLIFIIRKNSNQLFDLRQPFREIKLKFNKLVFIFSSVIASWIVTSILKDIFKYPRPFIIFADNVKPLLMHGGLDSFPSGHATFFGALVVSTFFVNKKLGYICLIAAFLVGSSRVIAGIHFPIDILVGYILGALFALVFKHCFFARKAIK